MVHGALAINFPILSTKQPFICKNKMGYSDARFSTGRVKVFKSQKF